MILQTVLEIIKLLIEAYVETLKGIPVERREQAWERHEKRIEPFMKFFEKLSQKENPA